MAQALFWVGLLGLGFGELLGLGLLGLDVLLLFMLYLNTPTTHIPSTDHLTEPPNPNPLIKVKLDTLDEYPLGQPAHPIRHKPPPHPHHIIRIGNFLPTIQRPPRQHLIVDHPQRPHIRLLTVVVLDVGLWGHVGGTPDIIEHLGFLGVGDLAESEVADFGSAVLDEDVGGFEVAVDDPAVVEAFTPGDNPGEQGQSFLFGETAA